MLSKRLKLEREKLHISQNKLSKKINVSQQTIGSWETSRTEPSYDNLQKLSKLFNVSIDYLLGYSDIRNSNEILTPDKELAYILSDPDMHVAFQDYKSWTDEDKKELIAYLKAKRVMRKNKDK